MLEHALAAVTAACRVARVVQRDLERVREITKDDRSPVTVADFAVQAVVARALRRALGETLIVGEEHAGMLREAEHAAIRDAVVEATRLVDSDAAADEVLDAIDVCDHDATATAYWTLDPVDGTKGFLRGGQYAIALARVESGAVTLGVLGCPNLSADFERPFDDPDERGVIFTATAGGGCSWRPADDGAGTAAPVTAATADQGVIRICESVEASHSKHDATQRVLERLGRKVAYARLDSQCKYAVVARGQADAYLRMPTRKGYVEKIWDHAAGKLVAEEAGAIVTDIGGRPLDFGHGPRLERNRGVICGTPSIQPALIETIGELGLATERN